MRNIRSSKTNIANYSYSPVDIPSDPYNLVIISFFHLRWHLAIRYIDTLIASKLPKKTLLLAVVDRDTELYKMIQKKKFPSSLTVRLVSQEGEIQDNPYGFHMDYCRKLLSPLKYQWLSIIDSDFELHSDWFLKGMELAEHCEEPEVKIHTVFNNATGTGWRHGNYHIGKIENFSYGLKHDCGSGQMIMTKSVFDKLGSMHDEHDIAWMRQIRDSGWKVASTIPSYAQHTGYLTSILGHDEHCDSAMDFTGSYKIPSLMCGNWKLDTCTNICIHRNGWITKNRIYNEADIIGHVSPHNDIVADLIFDEWHLSNVNFSDNENNKMRLKSNDKGAFPIPESLYGFHLIQTNDKFWGIPSRYSLNNLPDKLDSLPDVYQAENIGELCSILKNYATSEKDKQGIQQEILKKSNIYGYDVFYYQSHYFAVSHGWRLHQLINQDMTITKYAKSGDLCFAANNMDELINQLKSSRERFNPLYTREAVFHYMFVKNALYSLQQKKLKKTIVLFGAGLHTEWLLFCFSEFPIVKSIQAIIDDNHANEQTMDIPVIQLNQTPKNSFVILSSDTPSIRQQMKDNLKKIKVESIYDIYKTAPPGPYHKYWSISDSP